MEQWATASPLIKYFPSQHDHFGINKTYNLCKELFTRKNMRKKIASHVITCDIRQKSKYANAMKKRIPEKPSV